MHTASITNAGGKGLMAASFRGRSHRGLQEIENAAARCNFCHFTRRVDTEKEYLASVHFLTLTWKHAARPPSLSA